MDLNDLRIGVTLASLVLFIGLMLHTYSRRRRADHEAAAWLPFADDEPAPSNAARQEQAP